MNNKGKLKVWQATALCKFCCSTGYGPQLAHWLLHYAHHIAHVEQLMHCAHCDAWIAMPNKLVALIIALVKIYKPDA